MTSKITVGSTTGFTTGTYITICTPDTRWWRRLLFALILRRPPYTENRYRIAGVSGSDITIDRESNISA